VSTATVICPHCSATNPSGSAFCESCGKALPPPVPSGPRVVGADDVAATSAGLTLQTGEAAKQAKKAANALLTVSILITFSAALILVLINVLKPRDDMPLPIGMVDVVINLFIAALFWALWMWSRKNPLPPAIVGLVLYITITVVQLMVAAMLIKQAREAGAFEADATANPGSSSGPPPGFGGIFIRIFILLMLVQAVHAGVKHRRLLRQQRALQQPGPLPGAV
jgi:hypothetical protein